MWNSYWQEALTKISPARTNSAGRIAIVGIGNELRGDDAAGLVLIDRLDSIELSNKQITWFSTGAVPENCTGQLRKIKPEHAILVDAAQMDLDPGQIAVIEPDTISGFSGSTHSLPFDIIIKYIREEIGCQVWILGIQPAHNEVLTSLSPQVRQAVKSIADFVANQF